MELQQERPDQQKPSLGVTVTPGGLLCSEERRGQGFGFWEEMCRQWRGFKPTGRKDPEGSWRSRGHLAAWGSERRKQRMLGDEGQEWRGQGHRAR